MANPIRKPKEWGDLPFYKKIDIYSKQLTRFHAQHVDKLEAKAIVREMCGDAIATAPVVRVIEDPNDVSPSDLVEGHIIKSRHASGWNIDINKETTVDMVKDKLRRWNVRYNPTKEPHYRYLAPGFYIEEKIVDRVLGTNSMALTYMVRCIYGKPVSIGVKHNYSMNHYDLDWNELSPLKIRIPIPKPVDLQDMLYWAGRLSQPFEFVRMDFFLSACGRIYFSEYTFTPAACSKVFTDELEKSLACSWV